MLSLKIITSNPIESRHVQHILRLFYYNGNPLPMNKVIWFLIVLFWVEIFNFLLKNKNIFIILLLTLATGYLFQYYSHKFKIRLPLGLDIMPMALFFYLIGKVFNNYHIKFSKNWKTVFILIITSILFCVLNYKFFIGIDMMKLKYDNILLILSSFTLGSLSLLSLSALIEKQKAIEYFGKNSLVVLGMHLILIRLMNVIFDAFNLNIKWYYQFIIILLILYPIIVFINNYLPFFIGAGRQNVVKK